MKEIHEEKMR